MRTCNGALLIFVILVGCSQMRTPPEHASGSTATPIVIADGQRGASTSDGSEWLASPPVVQAIASARAYWSARDSGYEEEVRVLGVAAGAFSRPDAEQQAVLFSMGDVPRCCPKRGLALLEGGELVRSFAFEGLDQEVRAIPDIDRDGRDELVFGGSFGMGGQWSSGVTLVAIGEDGPSDLGTVNVYESACGAGYDGATSARISVVPGSAIMIQHYSQPSCESEVWQATGVPEPLALVPPEESRYVELSGK